LLTDRRVVLVDDTRLQRDHLENVLVANGAQVTCAPTLASFCAAVTDAPFALILLDSRNRDFKEILHFGAENGHSSRILVFGLSGDDLPGIHCCARAGVMGYHLKSESLQDLLAFSQGILADGAGFSPKVLSILLRQLSQPLPDPTQIEPILTARESEVVEMVRQGLSNREIAARLYVSVHTVKNHVHSILKKLDMQSRLQILAS
jgi:DNA-binding NarL/FixJ family response regulator